MMACCNPCSTLLEDAHEITARKKKEEIRESLRKIQGLSRASKPKYVSDFETVVDIINRHHPYSSFLNPGFCTCGMDAGAIGTFTCLFVWLIIYAISVTAFQLRIFNSTEALPLKTYMQKYTDRAPALLDLINSFHWFFSIMTFITAVTVSSSFCVARSFLASRLHQLMSFVIEGLHDEFVSQISEGINADFYSYFRRLPTYTVLNADFCRGEARKIHRRLNHGITELADTVNAKNRSRYGINAHIYSKLQDRLDFINCALFSAPAVLNFLVNLVLIGYVFNVRYGHHHVIKSDVTNLNGFKEDPMRAFQSEGFRILGFALAVNFCSLIYLMFSLSTNTVYCALRFFYSRIYKGGVGYIEGMVESLWDEVVVEGVAPLVEDVRKNILFFDETTGESPTLNGRYDEQQNYDIGRPSFGGMPRRMSSWGPEPDRSNNRSPSHTAPLLGYGYAHNEYPPPYYPPPQPAYYNYAPQPSQGYYDPRAVKPEQQPPSHPSPNVSPQQPKNPGTEMTQIAENYSNETRAKLPPDNQASKNANYNVCDEQQSNSPSTVPSAQEQKGFWFFR